MTLSTTLLGTNISLSKAVLKMSFLFPRWDMLIPWRVSMIRHVLQPGFSFCTHGPSPKPSSSQVARVEQIKRNTLSSANLGFSRWWLNQPFWKNISQNGNLPQVGLKIKYIGNHHLVFHFKFNILSSNKTPMPAPAISWFGFCFSWGHFDSAGMEPFWKKGTITCKTFVGGFRSIWERLVSLNGSILPQTVVRIKHASNQDHRESLETVTSFEQNTIIESNKTHAEAKTLCRFFLQQLYPSTKN